jgi:topoisomerase-4 subunit A
MFIHRPGQKLLVASSSGRGFVVEEDAVIAQTRNGKQVLVLGENEEAVACAAVGEKDDAVAVVGSNRKLLVFPLADLPALSRGRGVIVQRYAKGGLADAKTLVKAAGLTWRSGKSRRQQNDLKPWLGKRAQAGKIAPKGFPRSNRFGG